MSEDRLEKALDEMRREDVDAGTLDAARARVWDKVTNAAVAGCAEFRPDFRAYLSGTLTGSRRVLMEDHLSRCPACRTALAEMKGERRVIAMPQRSSFPLAMRWGTLAAAAALVLSVVYLGRDTIDAWLAPGGPRATVVSASGGLYRLPGGALEAGAAIGEKETDPHGPGRAGRAAPRRRIDGGCQRANGAVRDRRLERPGHSSPARRRHRPGREAAPRPPARPDA